MAEDRGSSDYERLFIAELGTIEQAISFIARRHRLKSDEAEELTSRVHTRLIDDDYAVLRKFEGRSSLRTYLTVVIRRVFLDYRVSQWGKWRPSTQARREGPIAELLERLTVRQSLGFDQACALMESAHRVRLDRTTLEAMYDRLPRRPRRHFVREDVLAQMPCPAQGAERLVTAADRGRTVVKASKLLRTLLSDLSAEDRTILRLRFVDELTMAEIAAMLSRRRRADTKMLYRHVRRLLRRMRIALERKGIEARDLLDAIGSAEIDMPHALGGSTLRVGECVFRAEVGAGDHAIAPP